MGFDRCGLGVAPAQRLGAYFVVMLIWGLHRNFHRAVFMQ
jgi:hypothetical protein